MFNLAEIGEFLVFASQHTVRGIPTDYNPALNTDAFSPVTGANTNFVGLDYDASAGYFYYSEVRKDIIWRRRIDGSGQWFSC